MPNSKNRYFRTTAAAAYCGSAKSTFDKYRLTGDGPTFMKIGRSVVYDIDDLDAWMATHRRTSTSDRGPIMVAPRKSRNGKLSPAGPMSREADV